MPKTYRMNQNGSSGWKKLLNCLSICLGLSLIGRCLSKNYEFTNKMTLYYSPIEGFINKQFDNKTQELENLKFIIGEPWEGFEIAKVQLNSSSINNDTKTMESLDGKNNVVFGKYKKLEINYPLGSKKKLIALQNCKTGVTALINYSPMRIKTEFSIYLSFGSNIDPINNQGLTYLMGFIFLNMASEVDNYLFNSGEYIEKQKDNSLTSVTVSSLYTKLTVTVSDDKAIEALKRFINSVGYSGNVDNMTSTSKNDDGEFYIKNRPLTTKNLLNSLCRLYYIYKSCLRDEEYRISFIKTSMRAIDPKKSKEEESSSFGSSDKVEEDLVSDYFSNCGIFSTYWQKYLNFFSTSSCSFQSNIIEANLSSSLKDWLHELKQLIKEHYEKYWLPENMNLYIDSALDYRLFEKLLASEMATFSSECDNKGKLFIENDLFMQEIEIKKKYGRKLEESKNQGFDENVDLNDRKSNKTIKIFNVVPLSYKKSVLDIDYKIKLKNISQLVSISLTRVMDVVTTLFLDSKMVKRLRDELGIIRDLKLTWRLHYSSLKLRLIFRFILKSMEVSNARKVMEDFYSYSIFLFRQFERTNGRKKSNPEFKVSKELFDIVDEIQRLNEINWHLQYLYEDLPTQLTTPINNCGTPIQVSQPNNLESNWIKNEIRIYNPLLFKNYPQLILSSIHRSLTRLPKECDIMKRKKCNCYRTDHSGKISKANSILDTGSIVFVLMEFIIKKIVELKANVIFTDPYFRYRTDFVLKVRAYNYHEYVNLQFSSYYQKNNLLKEDFTDFTNSENWTLPERIVNFETSMLIPDYEYYKNSTAINRQLSYPRISYKNELSLTTRLENFKFYSPIVFVRSIIRTKLSPCKIFKDCFCEVDCISKRHTGLIMLKILSDIFNISIEKFLESEPIPGYMNILEKLSHNSSTKYGNWRISDSLTKPFHFGSIMIGNNEIELNFVGPSCSLIEYMRKIFKEMNSRFKPLKIVKFYQILRNFMKNEIKRRKNRTPMDFIRYYQGILQYEDYFEDESFITTGISITYDNYLSFHNYIIDTLFNKDSDRPRQKGFMETVVLGITSDEFNKRYTETILDWIYFEKPDSYKEICMLQEPYFAFSAGDEPLIIRQTFTDGILTTSSASIRFQLPCNKNSSTGFNSSLSDNDIFFKDEKEYKWETNDGLQPRCIFNTVASRVLERILRKYFSSIVRKLVLEMSQSHSNNTNLPPNLNSNFAVRGEVEVSFYRLNSIPQFTLYILSSHFDSFTLLSILNSSIKRFKTDIIDSEEVLSEEEFSSVKSYFIRYYCIKEKIQIRNLRASLLEMSKWRYNYNWKHESCNLIRTLKKKHIVQFYYDYFLMDSPYRRSYILLLQAPPFNRLISYSKQKGTSIDPVSTVFQNYIVSLLGKCDKADYYRQTNTTKDADWNISMLSYPRILQSDIGILDYKYKNIKKYQPRCSKFMLEAINTEKQN
ncbi:hypothetical protein [Cryptosporidium parvum Iowa II]|uniref:Uncharacterized protein n=2 Tax=Cryptosporidium parvum TaxID=5807 RepID=Q5CYW4_CRYPI|nr:hypothetical protein [Cryptosporidium parvum Iowa II]EAK90558.1 hypothetical protein cgd7_770 [Cryptosporidium parvum Iowa II]QOY40391.1 LuxS/M16 peptidase-like Metalloenzyme [Cryptosporidium parvum]WKS78758.1 hypothetical protein CPCDC_7g770 [Cryptosporidium sp. 43IA8]WRK33244.1 LuxS/M16 peptidase-like Metalloenzyme [Cryptosporidium parvum]|eukprot:QOY40391.1 hypothetical protein CPATCC_003233 [Cryptosporidium parvum]